MGLPDMTIALRQSALEADTIEREPLNGTSRVPSACNAAPDVPLAAKAMMTI
jgi:hypothetical protein